MAESSPPARTCGVPWADDAIKDAKPLVDFDCAANRPNGDAPFSLAALWQNWRQYSAAALSYPFAD